MIGTLAGALSVMMAVAARPVSPEHIPTGTRHRSVADAVAVALVDAPIVVAFGELHQTHATAGIPSALRRFTTDILPAVSGRLSHLVVETWITNGRCGAAEQAVTKDVEKTTERPAATESEIERLIREVDAAGITPRILSITCADYEAMRPAGQEVDYDKTLRITSRALETATLRALRDRGRMGARVSPVASQGVPARAAVAIYGGALHNDVHPDPQLAAYSFACGVRAATLGRYVEIDLIVPEYAAANPLIRTQSWWRAYLRTRRAGDTVLVRRSARSFVIVFPSGPQKR